MFTPLIVHQEIDRQRQADRLREATQERLARTGWLDRAPAARMESTRLARLLHLRRARTVAAEPAPAPTGRA
jgi:hypothetical protein